MTKTLAELSERMRDIDFAMLSTHTSGGAIAARPMSNNRDVDYGGDAWFFADEARLPYRSGRRAIRAEPGPLSASARACQGAGP